MSPARTTVLLALALLVAGCGKSRQQRDCEKLKDRVILISLGISVELQKVRPEGERVDRGTMERQMREKLDGGDFMRRCLELDPKEVDCLANAETKEQWVECGFDQLMLP